MSFFISVGLELHFGDEELRHKPCETTVQQNSSNPHKEVKIARLHQQMHFNITFAFVDLISNDYRQFDFTN